MKKKILLTNDDGKDSPLFSLLLELLKNDYDISFVVPKREQSWQGKAMTRFNTIEVSKISLNGIQGYCIDGTPADCTNFALYNIGKKFDLAIAGINFGTNAGLGYTLSSGTIGAGLEANIGLIPALTLSQDFANYDYDLWSEKKTIRPQLKQLLKKNYQEIIPKLLQLFWKNLKQHGILTWSINIPTHYKKPLKFKPAKLGKNLYQRYFSYKNDSCSYSMNNNFETEKNKEVDSYIVKQGDISITKLNIFSFGRNNNFLT